MAGRYDPNPFDEDEVNPFAVFYFIGFGQFCLKSVLSLWVIQQVYMYFRGSGKAAEMKREAARGALRAAMCK